MPATILVADDTALFRTMLADALREEGYAVLLAEDGEAVLRRLEETTPSPDLILLDLEMPQRSGEEVLASLKQDPVRRQIPVLTLTGRDYDAAQVWRLRELGAAGYVSKGASLDEMLDRVRGLLREPEDEGASERRVEVYALVEYHSGEQAWNGIAHSIGDDFLFVRTIQLKPVGTTLRLSLDLPLTEDHIEAEGIVEETVPYTPGEGERAAGLKIRWTSMPPGSRAALDAFLKARG